MKKIFALILTLALVFSLAAVPAYAADTTISGETRSATQEVTAKYDAGDAGTAVYSVTISWGSMDFDYTSGAWNPSTHAYNGNWDKDNDHTVTVTNHSNKAIIATLSYAVAESLKDNISGSFDKTTMNLATAVGTAFENAPTDTATLTLAGTLTETATVGTITVTIQ